MSENHRQYCEDWDNDDAVMQLAEYVRYNLHNSPESFDCFFSRAWDELAVQDQDKRYFKIMEVFNT
jgi:hypothetical protein